MTLNEFVELKGWDRPKAAEFFEISTGALHWYLLGARYPRPEIAARIRKKTKGAVTANDFLDEYEQKQTPRK
tara:strand:- start:1188 stop:1403 length:216 start_codon:yes stop_codon:yes gene_type:complete